MRVKRTAIGLLILVMFTVSIAMVTAEEEYGFNTYDKAVGVFFGDIIGTGINYHQWIGNWGINFTVGLFFFPEEIFSIVPLLISEPQPGEFSYGLGFEAQYMLYYDAVGDIFEGGLYIFGGVRHTGAIRKYDKNYVATEPYYVPGIVVGLGFGFESVFYEHVSIPVEAGLNSKWEYGSLMPIGAKLTLQAGFRYRF